MTDTSRSVPSVADGQRSSEQPDSVYNWLKRRMRRIGSAVATATNLGARSSGGAPSAAENIRRRREAIRRAAE